MKEEDFLFRATDAIRGGGIDLSLQKDTLTS